MRSFTLLAILSVTLCAPPALAAELAFLRGNEVWVSDSHGKGQRRVAAFEDLDHSPPALSPDGKWVAVASGRDADTGLGQIQLIPTSGEPGRTLSFHDVHSASSPVFSPDGMVLAMVTARNVRRNADDMVIADMSITVAEIEGERVRHVLTEKDVLLDTGYLFDNPSFSSDGRHLAWQESGSDVSGGFRIVDTAGRELHRHPRSPDDHRPYWRPQLSPDGELVLCHSPSLEGGAGSVLVVDLETGIQLELVEGANPTFVADGAAIIYERRPPLHPEKTELWRLELSPGASPERIVEDGAAPTGW